MLLEKISVDIIYIIVDYLNGCYISKFTNTSKDINEIESGKMKHNGQLMGKIKRLMMK